MPVLTISGTSNICFQGVNLISGIKNTSLACPCSLFGPGKESSDLTCAGLYVIYSFGIQFNQVKKPAHTSASLQITLLTSARLTLLSSTVLSCSQHSSLPMWCRALQAFVYGHMDVFRSTYVVLDHLTVTSAQVYKAYPSAFFSYK